MKLLKRDVAKLGLYVVLTTAFGVNAWSSIIHKAKGSPHVKSRLSSQDTCIRDSDGDILSYDLSCLGQTVNYMCTNPNIEIPDDEETGIGARALKIYVNSTVFGCDPSSEPYAGVVFDFDSSGSQDWLLSEVYCETSMDALLQWIATDVGSFSAPSLSCPFVHQGPTNLLATVAGASVTLKWAAPAGASSNTTYNIIRSEAPETQYHGNPILQAGVIGTTFTDNTVQDGSTYYYRVSATDGGVTSVVSNEAKAATQGALLTFSGTSDFGKVQMTQENNSEITIINSGSAAITLSSIDFAVGTQFSWDSEESTCVPSAALAPNATCTLSLTFNPTFDLKLAGPVIDTLNVTYLDQGLNQTNTASLGVSGTSLILLPTTKLSQLVQTDSCDTPTKLLGKAKPLPASEKTHYIQGFGCAITTIAEALNYALGKNEDPCTMNDFAMSIKDGKGNVIGFDSNNEVVWLNITNNYGDRSVYWDGNIISSTVDPAAAKLYVNSQLQFGLPVIITVPGDTAKGGHHFVVITGQAVDSDNNDTFSIDDAGHRNNTLLSTAYNNIFETRGSVEKIPSNAPLAQKSGIRKHFSRSDQSVVDIDVSTNADLVVTDSNGNQSGFDSQTGRSFNSISSAVYFVDGTYDNDTEIDDPDVSHFMYIYGSANQAYSISVIGNASGPYTLEVVNYDSTGRMSNTLLVNGVAVAGSVDQYAIQTDGSIIPVVTPTPVPVTPTPSPTPNVSPTPSQNAILILTPDKPIYSVGGIAVINVAVSSSYVLPTNSTLSIQALVNGIQDQQIISTNTRLFQVSTSALSSSSTLVQVSAILTSEPSVLSGIDREIAALRANADAASGLKRFWDEGAIVALEIARGVVSIFQHATNQTLEVDQLNLIAN